MGTLMGGAGTCIWRSLPAAIQGRHRRRGHERTRARGRRLGDRGNHGHADQVPQDRGHRRSRALSASGSAGEGDLHYLGPRLWAGRLLACPLAARPRSRLDRGRRSRRANGGASLPGELLVLADRRSAEKEFPGTGAAGNGIAPEMRTQHHWINQIKANCNVCHQMGNQATREIPKALGTFASSVAAWDTRVQVGQDGQGMSNMVTGLGRQRGLEMFADWTDRIARGDIPPAPPRPQGVERNLVLTMWDWGGPATFAHDELTTDKRNPDRQRLRADLRRRLGQRRIPDRRSAGTYGEELRIPVLDPKVPPGKAQSMPVPSPYWGDKLYWFDPAITNHAAMDGKGRVWMSSRSGGRRISRRSAERIRRQRSRRRRAASGRCSTSTRRRGSSSR